MLFAFATAGDWGDVGDGGWDDCPPLHCLIFIVVAAVGTSDKAKIGRENGLQVLVVPVPDTLTLEQKSLREALELGKLDLTDGQGWGSAEVHDGLRRKGLGGWEG